MRKSPAVPGRDVHSLHTSLQLRALSFSLTTKDLLSFCIPTFLPQTVVHTEQWAAKWGLLTLKDTSSLSKLTMK
jgi:hypothetical protein